MKLRVAVGILAALCLVVGCGGDDEGADPTVTTRATTTTGPTTTEAPTTTTDPAEEVKAAYLAYWEMYYRVNDPPNPADPQITELTTGPALPALLEVINTNVTNGTAFLYPPGGPPRTLDVRTLTNAEASIRDCTVDEVGALVNATTGEVLDDRPSTVLIDATLIREDGRWKVFRYEFLNKWVGVVPGCVA